MNKNTKNKVLAGVASCVVLGIGATVLMGMGPGSGSPGGFEEPASQKTVVETTTAHRGDIVVSGSFVGTVEPGQQVYVYPKASGEVVTANFSVGDTVTAGEVLFALDSTSLELDIAQTQAQINLKSASSSLQLEQVQNDIDTYSSNIAEGYNQTLVNAENTVKSMEAALQTANANLRSARRDYNDARDEGADDGTLNSLRDLRVQRELAVEQAQLSLEQAELALELAKKSVEETVHNSEYTLRSAELGADLTSEQISLQKLRKTLADYTVTAPISGVIEQKNVDVYDMASSQGIAYVISNKDAITVSFKVTESALQHIGLGDSITIEKDGEAILGSVSEISTMTDAATGLYVVKATVTDAPFELRSGSTVKIYADTQKAVGELLLPIDTVYYDNGTPYVYLFQNNTAVRANVETGISNDQYIHIKSGISMSDNVIATWSASLYDGAEVTLPGTATDPEPQPVEGNTEDPQPEGEDGAEAGEDTEEKQAIDSAGDPEPQEPTGDSEAPSGPTGEEDDAQ